MGSSTVPMDSVLTQNSNRKIGVTQIYFILRPLGSSDYHSSFQLVIQTFQWLHNDFSVTFPWLLRDFSMTLQTSVFQFTKYITKPVW